MGLKLYYDLMSQPSRALFIILKTAKCNFDPKYVDLRKGEHYSEQYTTVNRFQKVPVIDFNGFILSESVAIIKYLSREGQIPEILYPKDSKQQARVDEYLAWQHIGLRLPCSMYFRVKRMNPILTGTKVDPRTLESYEKRMVTAIDTFANNWLDNGTEFITGNSVTVADLLAACELEQPRMAGYDPAQHFDKVAVWWEKVRKHFSPYYEEAHATLNKIVNKQENVSKL